MEFSGVPIRATQHIRCWNQASDAQLILCKDNALCVVDQVDSVENLYAIWSFVSATIARHLNLATHSCCVLEVSSALNCFPSDPIPRGVGSRQTGTLLYIATLLPHNSQSRTVFDYLPDRYLDTLMNKKAFIDMLLFDKWLAHSGPPVPLYRRLPNQKQYEVSFFPALTARTYRHAPIGNLPLDGVFSRTVVYKDVVGWESFEPTLSGLIANANDLVHKTISTLPFALDTPSRLFVYRLADDFLSRRSKIRDLIARERDNNPSLFPLWTRRTFVPSGHPLTHAEATRFVPRAL